MGSEDKEGEMMRKTYKHKLFTAVFTDEDGYFSLTGEVDGHSGAVGDKIAEIDDQFLPLARMNLADCNTGAPLHAWANLKYHLKDGKSHKWLAEHYRMSEEDVLYFSATLNLIEINSKILVSPGAELTLKERMESFKSRVEVQWAKEAVEVLDLAEDIPANLTRGFVDPYDGDDYISQEYADHLNAMDEPDKAVAAAMCEDVDVLDVEEKGKYYEHYTVAGREYRVLTDDEADSAYDEYLDSYINDVLEIPDSIRPYFDEEEWKRDARQDGRGSALAGYDGEEREEEVNGTMYFLYRQ